MSLFSYPGIVQSVHDGDSLHIDLDMGFGMWNRGVAKSKPGMLVRLAACNARELSEPGGTEARDALAALLPVGTQVQVLSLGWDKYGGRITANVLLPNRRDLAALLVNQQWAAAWDGRGERPLPPWPRTVT